MRWKYVYLAILAGGILCLDGSKQEQQLHADVDNVTEIQGEKVKPAWRIGDRWLVETRSRLLQAPKGENDAQWSPVVQWQFTVRKRDKLGAHDCLCVEIQCLAPGRAQPVTTMWVDAASMVPRKIQTQLPVAGGFRTIEESYEFEDGQPAPIFAPLTALPIELPFFLGGQVKGEQSYVYESRPGPAGKKDPTEVTFAYEVQQQISLAQPEQVKGLFNREFAKDLENKTLVNIQLKTVGRQVRQIWQAGMPWPMFADNGATESRLIKVIRAD